MRLSRLIPAPTVLCETGSETFSIMGLIIAIFPGSILFSYHTDAIAYV
jgi:hypothetical protein